MTLQSTDLFAVHRSGTTYKADVTAIKSGILNSHIIQSATAPTLITHPAIVNGTLWVDTSKAPPAVSVWNPAANSGAGGWAPVGGGGVYTGPTAPPTPTNGMLWVNTSTTPPSVLLYDSSLPGWQALVTKTPVAPAARSLVLTDDAPGGNRFTSQKFTATLDLSEPGVPVATVGLKAWAFGAIPVSLESDTIASMVPGTGPTYSNGRINQPGDGNLENGFGAATPVSTNWANLFDGNTATYATIPSDPSHKVAAWIIFNTPIPMAEKLEVYTSASTSDSSKGWSGFIQTKTDANPAWNVGMTAFEAAASVPSTLAAGWREARPVGTALTGLGVCIMDSWPTSGGLTMNYHAVRVDGVILKDNDTALTITLSGAKEYANLKVGMKVTGKNSGAYGLIIAKPGVNQLQLVGLNGTFQAGEPLVHSSAVAGTKMYAAFNGSGAITTLQSADPGYVTMTGSSPYKLTFPATFPTGNAPDVDLPAGVQLLAEAKVSNASGTVTQTATAITPA